MRGRNQISAFEYGGRRRRIHRRGEGPGDWRWFFSTDVNPKNLDVVAKLKKEGKRIPTEAKNAAQEHIGVAIVVHRRWWDKFVDVRPINGRTIVAKLQTKPAITVVVVDAPHAGA